MRWRWVDRIVRMDPDGTCAGVKAVSLEEYSLSEPLGRRGALPETLMMECVVALARWSVVVASDFTATGAWLERIDFRFHGVAGPGARLSMTACPLPGVGGGRGESRRFAVGLEALGEGTLSLRLAPLAGYDDPAALRALWAVLGPEGR